MAEFDRSSPGAAELVATLDVRADGQIISPELMAAVTPPSKKAQVRGKHKKMPQNKDSFHKTSAAKRIDSQKRMVVKAALDSGEELPLHVMLDNMRWAIGKARTEEKLFESAMTAATIAQIISYRDLAQAAAQAAAPFLHAKIAPILPKGEKGVTVQLIIEDA